MATRKFKRGRTYRCTLESGESISLKIVSRSETTVTDDQGHTYRIHLRGSNHHNDAVEHVFPLTTNCMAPMLGAEDEACDVQKLSGRQQRQGN